MRGIVPVLAALGLPMVLCAQTAAQTGTQTVQGQVLNTLTGAPIARALVRLNGAVPVAALTDSEGRFSFADVPAGQLQVIAAKPGYYFGNNLGQRFVQPAAGSALTLKLAPEALITGTIAVPRGMAYAGLYVVARHRVRAGQWNQAAMSQVNGRGEFRMALQAGDYIVETNYRSGFGMNAQNLVLMPVRTPVSTGTGEGATLHAAAGQELRLDLRPEAKPLYDVHVGVEGLPEGEQRLLPAIAAKSSGGASFTVQRKPQTGGASERETIYRMPAGSYRLQAQYLVKGQTLQASATVEVAGDGASTVLQFQPMPAIPVEVTLDDPEATASTQNPLQLVQSIGLVLVKEDDGLDGGMAQQMLRQNKGEPLQFTVLPGAYRLRSMFYSGTWSVQSARYGGLDLFEHPLTVASGSGDAPIQIVLGRAVGTVAGTVQIAGKAGSAWVALFPAGGTLFATSVRQAMSDGTGQVKIAGIPVGTYDVVAYDQPQNIFEMGASPPESAMPYARRVTIRAGENAAVQLEAILSDEVKP